MIVNVTRHHKEKPSILQILPALKNGGVERGTIDVALSLQEAGYGSLVASAGGSMVHDLNRANITHIELPLESKNPLVMFRNAQRLASLVERYGIDIIHARSRAPAWSGLQATKKTGTQFVTTVHSPYSGANSIFKNRYNRIMTRGNRVIAISRFIADHIARYYAPPSDRVSIIYRGVDTDIFDPGKVSSRRVIQLAEKWRLTDHNRIIMLPARLSRWKGQEVMIDALAHLGRRDVTCILVGSDQGKKRYRHSLETRIKKMGLSPIIHLTGHCTDMPAAYMLADVVVSASTLPEGFGRVVAEAQALGKPVLVSDHGGAPEVIWRHRTGWVYPPGDSKALAEKLAKILSLTTEQRVSLAERAVRYTHKHFTKRKMCDQTLALYQELYESKMLSP